MQSGEVSKLAIVGTGPSGYSAAVYAARAMLKPTVFGGPEPGGQLMYTTEVENYPGYSEGVVGPQLMDEMRKQAVKFGSILKFESVEEIDFTRRPFKLVTEVGEYRAEAVILSMGARSRMLGVGEEDLLSKGVSTCAVCDAAFYKDKKVYVVGGGDAAIEDAWALSKYTGDVTMIVRRGELRASVIMKKRVEDNPDKIKVMWNSEVVGVMGEERLRGIRVMSDGREKEISAEGLFLAIGHIPATEFLKNSEIKMDKKGYVITGLGLSEGGIKMAGSRIKDGLVRYPTMTSVEGVFAAGDVVDFRYQQAVTAGGMGVQAALDAEWWLNENNVV